MFFLLGVSVINRGGGGVSNRLWTEFAYATPIVGRATAATSHNGGGNKSSCRVRESGGFGVDHKSSSGDRVTELATMGRGRFRTVQPSHRLAAPPIHALTAQPIPASPPTLLRREPSLEKTITIH